MSPLDDLSCQRFREVLESDFEVRHEGGSLALKLVDVVEKTESPRLEQFALIFRGPLQPLLPQCIHRFEHPVLGTRDMFTVPLGPNRDGMQYEVVFNRMRRPGK
jgi:hypothetical protein